MPRRVLEVGTRFGYSLVAMVAGSAGIKRVVSVDNESAFPGSQRKAAGNLRSVGFKGEAEFLVADSLEAMDALAAHEMFDLVHLDADADHKRERALKALNQAWKLLLPGGYLLVDDASYLPEVEDAFESFRNTRDDWDLSERIPTHRGLGVLRKEKEQHLPVDAPAGARCVLCHAELEPCWVKDGLPLFRCKECGLVQLALADERERDQSLPAGRTRRHPLRGSLHRTRAVSVPGGPARARVRRHPIRR